MMQTKQTKLIQKQEELRNPDIVGSAGYPNLNEPSRTEARRRKIEKAKHLKEILLTQAKENEEVRRDHSRLQIILD